MTNEESDSDDIKKKKKKEQGSDKFAIEDLVVDLFDDEFVTEQEFNRKLKSLHPGGNKPPTRKTYVTQTELEAELKSLREAINKRPKDAVTLDEFSSALSDLRSDLSGGSGEDTKTVTQSELDSQLKAFRDGLLQKIENKQAPASQLSMADVIVGGPEANYQSIQKAWDDADWGAPVSIGLSPSYDPTVEDYPISCYTEDHKFKPLTIVGLGPSATQIGHKGVEDNVLYIDGNGWRQNQTPYRIANLSVTNHPEKGKDGLVIQDTPFGMLQNIVVSVGRHGANYCSKNDGCYGSTLYNVQAWNCGQDGVLFGENARAHSTHLYGSWLGGNGRHGLNAVDAVNLNVIGGTIQYNSHYGVRPWGAKGLTVRDAYIEGNAGDVDYPVDIYARGADGLTVEGCYFNGSYYDRGGSNGLDTENRGVNTHETNGLRVSSNIVRNYSDRFIAQFGGRKADVSNNWALDDTTITAQ